ncbi:MAG: PilN domain-containing protein [Myxococcota bacterium]|jgi:Tfp pilus assembly protein PilN|nr:PilN domain-containing protein [Myxococcota bacterium]
MMVRINLLPGKKRSSASSLLWRIVALMSVLLLTELVLLYWVYSGKATDLKKRNKEVADAKAQVQRIKSEIAALPDLEKQAQELEGRERALAELAAIRIGPHHFLDELKRLLSRPRTKTTIKAAKDAQWNVAWDAENVFVEKIFEEGPGQVGIEGLARGLDDIAEFWLRMRSSRLFQQVRLSKIVKGKAPSAGEVTIDMELLKFEFSAKVNFYYQTKDGVALIEQLGQPDEGEKAE